MKASKFTDAQKVFIIKQGEDGMTVAEICWDQSGNLSQLEEEVRSGNKVPAELIKLSDATSPSVRSKRG